MSWRADYICNTGRLILPAHSDGVTYGNFHVRITSLEMYYYSYYDVPYMIEWEIAEGEQFAPLGNNWMRF